jgi:hypothetical protein
VYDLAVKDQKSGTTLAVCKNIQFTGPTYGNKITGPVNESVCPTFPCYGAGTTSSPIDTGHCTIGGQPANVTVLQPTDQDGAWVVQFNGAALTAPNSTTIVVTQQNGDAGQSSIMVIGCTSPPPPPPG